MTNKQTPTLRFKDFDDEWLTTKLNKLVDVYDGTHQTPNYTETGVKFLSVENIETLDSEKYISFEDFEKEFKIFPEQNDILMTRIGSIGVPNIIQTDEKLAYYVSLALLKNNGNVNSNYLKTYIESNPFQSELWKRTLHIAFPKKINKNEIANALVSVPLLPEQSAIGSLFQSLDELLAAYKGNMANYQAFKASMLSKMFPKAGQTTPEIRLEGFDGEWEIDKFDNYLTESRIPGNTGANSKKLTVKLWGKGVVPKEEAYSGSENTKYFKRSAGQFIYSKLDFQNQAFGIIPNELDQFESTLDVPSFDVKNLDIKFLLEYVMRRSFYEYQGLIANGSRKAKRIQPEDFMDMPLLLPSIAEQQAIGSFFTNLDQLISTYQEKIDHLETLKKKLLQDMFI